MEFSQLSIPTATLVMIGVFSIPGIIKLATQLRATRPNTQLYEDEDGEATSDAEEAYSDRVPKTLMALCSLLGMSIALTSVILAIRHMHTGFVGPLLILATWIILALQVTILCTSHGLGTSYDLGRYVTLSCVFFIVTTSFQNNQKNNQVLAKDDWVASRLRIAESITVIVLGICGISVPRRPDVFHNGCQVDRFRTVSLLGRLSWSWPAEILRLATQKRDLDLEDLPRPDRYRRAKEIGSDWDNTRTFTRSLWKTIVVAHKARFALQWLTALLSAMLNFAPQWCLLNLLQVLEGQALQKDSTLYSEAWIWAFCMTLAIIAQSWVESYIFWLSWAEISVPIRAQLTTAIFKKAMMNKKVVDSGARFPEKLQSITTVVNTESRNPVMKDIQEDTPGRQSALSLISTDTKRVSDFSSFNFALPESLLKLGISFSFLINLLGWQPPLIGLVSMSLILPVNIFFSRRYLGIQTRLTRIRDKKLSVISEALQGIRQIKFAAAESFWEDKIDQVRELELGCINKAFMNDLVLIGCWITSPVALAVMSLAAFAIIHGNLTPSVAFVSLGVFRALETTLSIIPELMTDLLEARVSANRIENFLNSSEVDKEVEVADQVTFTNATIAWPTDAENSTGCFMLRSINATFPNGELSIILGKTGTGKSLMLAAILGEAKILSGCVSAPLKSLPIHRYDHKATDDSWIVPGAMAFVSQTPWLENTTIKENIIFGLPFNKSRFWKVVEACALQRDFETLPDGESTEVGSLGVNLSGGQKWRVTFARALYSRAAVLIMDDIFSAVDSQVGRHIFNHCLNGELAHGRTRVLVTHHAELCLPIAKYMVELGKGSVVYTGLPILERSIDAACQTAHETYNSGDTSEGKNKHIRRHRPLISSETSSPRLAHKFIEVEAREQGAIKWHVYAKYMYHSGGYKFWSIILTVFLVTQGIIFGKSWWMRCWTKMHDPNKTQERHSYLLSMQQPSSARPKTRHQPSQNLYFYLGTYILLSIAGGFLATVQHFFVFRASIRASKALFTRMRFAILRAPIGWHHRNPLGRVLNRFTVDFQSVDTKLGYSIALCLASFMSLVGAVIAGVLVSSMMAVFSAALLAVGTYYARIYLQGAMPVKRLESVANSPVLDLCGIALDGMDTIRAFDRTQRYFEQMYLRIDDWTVATWHMWLFNRWIGWRISAVGSFFAFFISAVILFEPDRDPALVGFALAFALEFPSQLMWTIRHYSSTELEMNAAERVIEYSEIPTEPADEGHDVPLAWPTEGRIEVNNLVVTHTAGAPPVLNGITFSVNSNETIGIVGRTGAGKTTLTMALFRLLEAQSGTIRIDGVDLSQMKLHDVRSRLDIIPQDPVLFSGSLRSNLDPSSRYTDAELFRCLRLVHLIPGTFDDLSSPISGGGLNLSQGQRQLVCFARALLCRSKVMVLDEATSSVDKATDSLIQRAIRERADDYTLLVVAHRLRTVAEFDRILVISDGKAVEYDTPKNLWNLGSGKGAFRRMCEESCDVDTLRNICLGRQV